MSRIPKAKPTTLTATPHPGRTPEAIRARQQADAERDRQRVKANLPAATASKSVAAAVPDSRTSVQRYVDEIAPASIVGRMVKFSKDGEFVAADDNEAIGDDVDFVALCDQTLVGYIKFNGEGEPPDRHMGLLYDGFVMPPRQTLGDDDQAQWQLGLDGKPADPWQHHIYLVLQNADTQELFTFVTSSITGRRAIGTLLRHFDRMQKAKSGAYPVVRLKVGGFQHKDERVGWVKTPMFVVVGKHAKDDAARPDTSLAADMNDELPL
jgi:hypothetical protein